MGRKRRNRKGGMPGREKREWKSIKAIAVGRPER